VFDAAGSSAFRHRSADAAASASGASATSSSSGGGAGGRTTTAAGVAVPLPEPNWSAIAGDRVRYRSGAVVAVGGRSPTGAAWFSDDGSASAPWTCFYDGDVALSHEVEDAITDILERCDNVGGAQMLLDVNSGFAGLGQALAVFVREECPRAPILVGGILDSALSSALAPVAASGDGATPAYDAAIAAASLGTGAGGRGGGSVGSLDIADYGARLRGYQEDMNVALTYAAFAARHAELGVHFVPLRGTGVSGREGSAHPQPLTAIAAHAATWRRVIDSVLVNAGDVPDDNGAGDDIEGLPDLAEEVDARRGGGGGRRGGAVLSTLAPPLAWSHFIECLDPSRAVGVTHSGWFGMTDPAAPRPVVAPLSSFYAAAAAFRPAATAAADNSAPVAWTALLHDSGWPTRAGGLDALAATWGTVPAAQRWRYTRSSPRTAGLPPWAHALTAWEGHAPATHEVCALVTGGQATADDLATCIRRVARRDRAFDFRLAAASGGGGFAAGAFSGDDLLSRLADIAALADASGRSAASGGRG